MEKSKKEAVDRMRSEASRRPANIKEKAISYLIKVWDKTKRTWIIAAVTPTSTATDQQMQDKAKLFEKAWHPENGRSIRLDDLDFEREVPEMRAVESGNPERN